MGSIDMSLLTKDEYEKLSPAGKQKYASWLARGLREYLNELNEELLTPRIPFKTAEPPDTESSVRQFFIEHPDVDEIRVGDTLYRR
jgi:hypothetical protein